MGVTIHIRQAIYAPTKSMKDADPLTSDIKSAFIPCPAGDNVDMVVAAFPDQCGWMVWEKLTIHARTHHIRAWLGVGQENGV